MISTSKLLLLCLLGLQFLSPIHSQQSPQTCSPNVILPNTLKDVITFVYAPNATNYTYPFIPRMFQSTPSIVMAINSLNFTQISTEIGFSLQANFGSNVINFMFNAPNLQWTIAGITFWIVSRADLYVGTIALNNLGSGSVISSNVILNSTLQLFAANNTVLLPFITTLNVTSSSSNFSVMIAYASRVNFTYTLTTSVGANSILNSLVATFIVYNPILSAFASNGGNITYFSLQGSQYSNIHNNIMPIYYEMLGFSGISLSPANSKRLSFKVDVIDDYVLQVSADALIDQLTVVIGTIGALPAAICSPCNNFIFQSSCVDACPALTYPYNYSSNTNSNGTIGKSCLICSNHLNQVINEFSTGCVCIPGYERTNGVCSLIIKRCTGANQIQSNGTCICSPGTVNISGVCGVCPNATTYNGSACVPIPVVIPINAIPLTINCTDPNSHANPSNTACICNTGYTQGLTLGSTFCQPICNQVNQIFNAITNACQCIPNFFNISGVCTQCTNGTSFNGTGCAQVNCTGGATLVNGRCVCPVGQIKVNSLCISCIEGHYADQVTNLCEQCMSNCQRCTDKSSCQLCQVNYVWNPTNLTCVLSAPAAPAAITLRPSYPKISPVGIVTDFQLPLVSPFPTLTSSSLSSIISYTVNDTAGLPSAVYYSQNPTQGNLVRAFLMYASGLLPVNPFQIQYNFTSSAVNLQNTLNVTYDMKGPLQFTLPTS